MKFFTYILFSEKLNKYYIGQTNNVEKRLKRHNNKQEKFTKKGTPWKLVIYQTTDSRSEAMKLEKKLKNFKSKKRLEAWIDDNS